ncbi:hypothetical protein AVEN_199944-1 [Araneus ventricosus]|uniref:Uncharacterized protein n=1 Tax=Araneus ventricosus TaxID=182803 RepID=A0A4Y2RE55_ARAVE|nr:hypothetical protein AVEN_199944-1 [Araneus ventricosus]
MSLRRRRSHYEQLTEFERGRVIGLREGGFSFRDIAERLGRNVSTVHDCWVRWSRDGTASRRPGSGRPRGTTEREDRRIRRTAVSHRTASAAEIRVPPCSVHSIDSKTLPFEKPELNGGRSGDLLCFLMKAGSALVPVMAVC